MSITFPESSPFLSQAQCPKEIFVCDFPNAAPTPQKSRGTLGKKTQCQGLLVARGKFLRLEFWSKVTKGRVPLAEQREWT